VCRSKYEWIPLVSVVELIESWVQGHQGPDPVGSEDRSCAKPERRSRGGDPTKAGQIARGGFDDMKSE
jgi:hypothetical protein